MPYRIMPPAEGRAFKNRDPMPQPRKIVGGGQSGGPGPDDRHTLARRRIPVPILFPESFGVLFRSKPFELPDGYRFVHLRAPADRLTGMMAHMPQHHGKGDLLPNDRNSFGKSLLADEAKITRYVDPGRAGVLAGDKRLHSLFPFYELLLVPHGAGRADLDACPAEPAPGLDKRLVSRNGDPGLPRLFRKLQNPCAAQLVACPHATAAADAPDEVVNKEGIVCTDGNRPDASLDAQPFGHAQVLLHRLQLAVEILAALQTLGRVIDQERFHGLTSQEHRYAPSGSSRPSLPRPAWCRRRTGPPCPPHPPRTARRFPRVGDPGDGRGGEYRSLRPGQPRAPTGPFWFRSPSRLCSA